MFLTFQSSSYNSSHVLVISEFGFEVMVNAFLYKFIFIFTLKDEMYYHPPSDHDERERFLPPRQPGPGIIRPKATKPLMIPVDAQPPPRERMYLLSICC